MKIIKIPDRLQPPAIISLLLFVPILISAALSGCSGSVPVSPPSSFPTPAISTTGTSQPDNGSHNILGIWEVTIDPGPGVITATPSRSLSAHWNVTDLLAPPFCPGCVGFSGLQFLGQNRISFTVIIQHPFPGLPALDAFDVKGIGMSVPDNYFSAASVSTFIENADGCTTRWSLEPWADINPFIDFATENPDRRFSSATSDSRELIVRLPDSGPFTFDYIIDACWVPPDKIDPANPSTSPHCNEPYGIDITVPGPLNQLDDTFQELTIEFSDWQNDGNLAGVHVEIPSLMPSPAVCEFDTAVENKYEYKCRIYNELDSPPGNYDALLFIGDSLNNPSNNNLAVWKFFTVTVTGEIPEFTGILITPDAAALPETGSTADYDLLQIYSDNSLRLVTAPIDWTIDGKDLNGNPLGYINSDGVLARLAPRWWGGTGIVMASYGGFMDSAAAFFCDPFADSADVIFGPPNVESEGFANPGALLGPPSGSDTGTGSLGVCSLGYGGVATLEFTDNIIVDGDGPDLIVFENPFYFGGCEWNGDYQHAIWNETAIVEVSQDGNDWFRFPCDYNPLNITCLPQPYENPSSFYGLAGNHPVLASVDPDGTLKNGIDPTDPLSAGGDAFDLADVGLDWCRFVRLVDTGRPSDYPGTELLDDNGDVILDLGKMSIMGAVPGNAGFDGDSVAAVHSASPLDIY